MSAARGLLIGGNELPPAFYGPLLARLAAGGLPTEVLPAPALLGQRDPGGAPPTWDGLVAAAHAALAALGPGAVLLGHSLGGLLALLAAGRAPPGVRPARLVLLEPAVAAGPWLARAAARAYRRDVQGRDRDRFVNQPGAFRRVARPEAFPAWALDAYRAARRAADPAVVGALLDAVAGVYPLPLSALPPTLIVTGARSGWRAALGAWWLARRLPAARRVALGGAGHWLANEADDALAAAILAAGAPGGADRGGREG